MATEIHVNFLNCDGGSPTSGHYLDPATGMLTISRPNCYWAVLGWQNGQEAVMPNPADYTFVSTMTGIGTALNTRTWNLGGTSEIYDPEKLISTLSPRQTVSSVLEVVERFWPNFVVDYPTTNFDDYAPFRLPGEVYQFSLPQVWAGLGAYFPGWVTKGTLVLLEMFITP